MKKQSSCPSALNREETGYSAQIGPDFFIREATLADAAIIWQTIYDNRVYLRTWLPFVDGLKEVADEEAFLNEQLLFPMLIGTSSLLSARATNCADWWGLSSPIILIIAPRSVIG